MLTVYPPIITDLPQADLPMPEIQGWLLQGETRQAVFFRIPAGSVVPRHSHGAQWGFVIDGRIELTIGGETRTYGRGECYEIPAGVPHSAVSARGALVLDLFADPDRYRTKS